jgi:hypothetical protein
MKTFKHKMTYTKDRERFMEMAVDIMNAFTANRKHLTEWYGKMEEVMDKEEGLTPVPFEAAVVAFVEEREATQYKYAKALYNYIYWEYDYITQESKEHPHLYYCIKHAMDYVERNGLSSFQKKYTKTH